MSVDIDWATLTGGPDGLELAASIREFMHDKFQQIALPRFIRSVQVNGFEFGDEPPRIELKDICDPLPDFYEDDEDEDGEDNDEEEETNTNGDQRKPEETGYGTELTLSSGQMASSATESLKDKRDARQLADVPINNYLSQLPRLRLGLLDHTLSRSSTPGPGGTASISYFHLPLSAGLSGTHTPLAAVAGGTPFPASWQNAPPWGSSLRQSSPTQDLAYDDPSTRPSTAHSHLRSQSSVESVGETVGQNPPEPEPTDVQIVLHISYNGNVRLSLTTEILLDYPMPSFVGIPVKLNITGLTFDGIALVAYLKKRAHFCFLGQEDAEMLVGAENKLDSSQDYNQGRGDKLGGLLREIKVESEIGQKDGGKQVLKNVGKVEKFVLDQVRRIFEDEFVYPSFWTFLV